MVYAWPRLRCIYPSKTDGAIHFYPRSSLPPFFFFFQAEDGIRDKLVTGVQTCALPIWSNRAPALLALIAGQVRSRERSAGARFDPQSVRGEYANVSQWGKLSFAGQARV